MSGKTPKVVDLEMIRHAMTEKAIRVSLDGDDKNAEWLPLSRVENFNKNHPKKA